MTKISKGYHRLFNRLNDFMCDYEFARIIYSCRNIISGNDSLFKYLDPVKHPELNKHDNTDQARRIIINHLRSTIAVTFIKESYEEVTEYLHYILNMGARSGLVIPARISDSVKVSITANEILSTTSHPEVISLVTKKIYQNIESDKSTIGLVEKICKRLDIKINQDTIDEAIKYLEMRHIFVHEDGKPNKAFKERYPDVKLNQKGRICFTDIDLHDVRDKIIELISSLDKEMVTKKLIISTELQP